jgi:hypothetical protein
MSKQKAKPVDAETKQFEDPVPMERKVLYRAVNLVDSLASAMVLAREAEGTISVDDLIKLLDPIVDTLKDLTEEHFPE